MVNIPYISLPLLRDIEQLYGVLTKCDHLVSSRQSMSRSTLGGIKSEQDAEKSYTSKKKHPDTPPRRKIQGASITLVICVRTSSPG